MYNTSLAANRGPLSWGEHVQSKGRKIAEMADREAREAFLPPHLTRNNLRAGLAAIYVGHGSRSTLVPHPASSRTRRGVLKWTLTSLTMATSGNNHGLLYARSSIYEAKQGCMATILHRQYEHSGALRTGNAKN
ncbi:uncharacterized protein MYCFIDRAFT_171126 [Pseudocercospora fijiensis CIRAD86]|uniref:Uncharacterized protein n=1 Tax=Pseudocercospora fijiensis (strain CIRAD86) TaxID=383855 RepID=N1QBX9_PSEFD|nr:uncharacterized protein MYCFIDRAFT_171126 [Pseudocercospora fijiensis CIRAD86]EME89716.1 hypothetical protein MYCFIDRAFT_171126 [Pseudocercospora fijiensis CIRAD86]